MGQNTLSSREMQAERLKIKQIGQQMANLAVQGAGLSTWEAKELVQIIEEVYFSGSGVETNPAGTSEVFMRPDQRTAGQADQRLPDGHSDVAS